MAIFMPKGAPEGGAKFAWALPGFDQEAFDRSEAGRNIAKMREIYDRYPDDEMHPEVIRYWESHGLKKELYDADVDGGEGKYAVFTPLDMDISKRYAIIYTSHGGMQPINLCETTGLAMLAGQEKYICVCPWNRGVSNDAVETEFPRILNAIIRKGYPVDESRVYAAGYSAGSDATGVLACAWPELIAAVSPDPGRNLFAKGRWYDHPEFYAKNMDLRMPMICVGGTMDGGDRYPFTEEHHFENFNIWMRHIVKVSGYEPATTESSQKLVAESRDCAERFFGVRFHETYTVRMEGLDWYCGDYKDDRGVTVARFVTGEGLPHGQTLYHAPIIWDFLKHFSRDTRSGGSIYTPLVIDGVR